MRLVSWNVNGIRAAVRKGFADWLQSSGADVVAMQEVRALPEQVPGEVAAAEGWHVAFNPAERRGYSGVGLLSRRPADGMHTSLCEPRFDVEGRLQIARFGALTVANVYFPNGSGTPLPGGRQASNDRVPYKLAFYRALYAHLEPARAAGDAILVVGDYNTAHRPIDLARPKQNTKNSGFLMSERRELGRWLRHGWTDTFRHVHGDLPGAYSWWTQRGDCRARNVGWRLDYVLASPGAVPYLRGAFIEPEAMCSDHCPVGVELDSAIVV
jgi:exodeoxyribonuclease III